MFEVSTISNANRTKDERVRNLTKVKNKECTYVIKYCANLNLFVIWNYQNDQNMNYSLKTIENKLSNGIMFADKGKISHSKDQSLVYFSYDRDLEKVLHLIINRI